MSDFGEAVRKGVLEVASHKFKYAEGEGAPFFFAGALVFEGDAFGGDAEDAAGGDGDAEDIFGKVFEGGLAVADATAVDNPVEIPNAGGYAKTFCFERFDEFGAVNF